MTKTLIHVLLIAVLTLGYFIEWKIAEKMFSPTMEEPEPYQELTSWQTLQLAIAKTESGCDPWVIGKTKDIGVLQITQIYVDEVNRLADTVKFCHNDAFSIEKSLQMFRIYQDSKNPDRDIEKAIRLHNPGGDSIGYTDRVMRNYKFILALEDVRKQIILMDNQK